MTKRRVHLSAAGVTNESEEGALTEIEENEEEEEEESGEGIDVEESRRVSSVSVASSTVPLISVVEHTSSADEDQVWLWILTHKSLLKVVGGIKMRFLPFLSLLF